MAFLYFCFLIWLPFLFFLAGLILRIIYMPALSGEKPMYYPYWAFWVFSFLNLLPFKLNYLVFILLILICTLFLQKLTGCNPWFLFLSFPFIWILWYGQAEYLSAAGLILFCYGKKEKKVFWLGIGLFLASLKPHITGPALLLMLFQLKNWRLRLSSFWLLFPLLIFSFFQWGLGWPVEWLSNILNPIFYDSYNNASLWVWVGPAALLLWIPALLIPVKEEPKVVLFICTTLLSMPYVPPYSQLLLYFFPMPVWVWVWGFIPWMQPVVGDIVFKFNFFIPALMTSLIYIFRVWKIPQFEFEGRH